MPSPFSLVCLVRYSGSRSLGQVNARSYSITGGGTPKSWGPVGRSCRLFLARDVAPIRGHTQKEELHQSCSFKAVIMLRLALVALIAALVHATTPDNVSSRLMIHVSFVQLV